MTLNILSSSNINKYKYVIIHIQISTSWGLSFLVFAMRIRTEASSGPSHAHSSDAVIFVQTRTEKVLVSYFYPAHLRMWQVGNSSVTLPPGDYLLR